MNDDYFAGLDEEYPVSYNTGTTVTPGPSVAVDTYGANDFATSLGAAFGNAASGILDAAGNAIVQTVNTAGNQVSSQLRPVPATVQRNAPAGGGINQTTILLLVGAVVVGWIVYAKAKE